MAIGIISFGIWKIYLPIIKNPLTIFGKLNFVFQFYWNDLVCNLNNDICVIANFIIAFIWIAILSRDYCIWIFRRDSFHQLELEITFRHEDMSRLSQFPDDLTYLKFRHV